MDCATRQSRCGPGWKLCFADFVSFCPALVVLAATAGPAAAAVRAELRLAGPAGVETYLAALEAPADRYRTACDALRRPARTDGRERLLWLQPGPEGPTIAGGAPGLDQEELAWARGLQSLVDVYQALGGGGLAAGYLFRISGSTVAVSRDRGAPARFDDPCTALDHVLKDLVSSGEGIATAVRAAVQAADSGAPLTAVLAGAFGSDGTATAARGSSGRVDITLSLGDTAETEESLGLGTDTPALVGPAGVLFTDIRSLGPATVTADMAVDGAAALGDGKIYVYAAGNRLKALAEVPIAIVAGSAAGSSGTESAPAAAEPLALGETVTGTLGLAAATRSYTIEVTAAGSLELTSEGTTDLVGELRAADGTPVASDDDGGSAYNFRLRAAVAPGVYTLAVRHCCSGGGDYAVSARLAAVQPAAQR